MIQTAKAGISLPKPEKQTAKWKTQNINVANFNQNYTIYFGLDNPI